MQIRISLAAAFVVLVCLPLKTIAGDFSYTWLGGGYFRQHTSGAELETANGGYLDASYALNNGVQLLATYDEAKFSSQNSCGTIGNANPPPASYLYCSDSSASLDDYRLGLGGHWPLTTSTDFVGSVEYAHTSTHMDYSQSFVPAPSVNSQGQECIASTSGPSGTLICATSGNSSQDSSGWRVTAGVRTQVVSSLEFDGSLGYLNFGSTGYQGSYTPFFVEAAAMLGLSRSWGLGLDWDLYAHHGSYSTRSELRLGLRYAF